MGEIKIQTEAGEIAFEVSGDGGEPRKGFGPASPKGTVAAKAARAMWKPVFAFAQELVLEARESDSPPSEIEMSFSVVAKASAEFVVVKGGGEGSVEVKLTWKAD